MRTLNTQDSLETELHKRLIEIVRESEWFMSALCATRALGLASWCIGAGAVRNLVWDKLHNFKKPSSLADIDVAYFDASMMSTERDSELQVNSQQYCLDLIGM